MHVLYFHQHFGTPKGGGGNRSYAMARKLVKNGHKVTMICGSKENGVTGLSSEFVRGRRTGFVDGIEVIEYDLQYSNSDGFVKRSWKFLKFASRSLKVALTEKYDVVFATTTPLTAGIPGIFAKVFRRKPFVFEVRDLWPELPREMGVIKNPIVLWMMSILEWVSYNTADRCIGLSPGIVEGIRKRGVDESRIELIPNGCDLDILGVERPKWRPEGVSEDDFMAIFTGAHGIANGLDAVLDAARVLKERKANHIKIVLVGTGKLKPHLIDRANQERLNNVVFIEPVNKETIASLMMSADIGMQVLANISAFYYGTSPNKFFDYIASGLPIINNYPGWLAELITENSCGYVVEPENPKAFAEQLLYASSNQDTHILMGRNARSLAEKCFNRDELSDKWVSWVLGAVNK